MDPLQSVQARIAGFPGYGDDLSRRRSDAYVRSYLGEALASLEARFGTLEPVLQQRFGDLLLRVGFADSESFTTHNGLAERAETKSDPAPALAGGDAATLDVADRAQSVDAAAVGQYLDDVTATLDRREAAMRAAAHPAMP